MDQWNRIETPEINPHTYDQWLFSKGGKNIKWENDNLFSKWCWESWTATCKSTKLEHILTPYTKINSKWLENLSIRYDTSKLLEDSIGKTFSDISPTSVFLGQPPKAIGKKKYKNKQTGPNQTYKCLHNKGNHLKKKKTTCRKGENNHKWCDR